MKENKLLHFLLLIKFACKEIGFGEKTGFLIFLVTVLFFLLVA